MCNIIGSSNSRGLSSDCRGNGYTQFGSGFSSAPHLLLSLPPAFNGTGKCQEWVMPGLMRHCPDEIASVTA
jgi:hypothetical protein